MSTLRKRLVLLVWHTQNWCNGPKTFKNWLKSWFFLIFWRRGICTCAPPRIHHCILPAMNKKSMDENALLLIPLAWISHKRSTANRVLSLVLPEMIGFKSCLSLKSIYLGKLFWSKTGVVFSEMRRIVPSYNSGIACNLISKTATSRSLPRSSFILMLYSHPSNSLYFQLQEGLFSAGRGGLLLSSQFLP